MLEFMKCGVTWIIEIDQLVYLYNHTVDNYKGLNSYTIHVESPLPEILPRCGTRPRVGQYEL
jgi:hypothetical protein